MAAEPDALTNGPCRAYLLQRHKIQISYAGLWRAFRRRGIEPLEAFGKFYVTRAMADAFADGYEPARRRPKPRPEQAMTIKSKKKERAKVATWPEHKERVRVATQRMHCRRCKVWMMSHTTGLTGKEVIERWANKQAAQET